MEVSSHIHTSASLPLGKEFTVPNAWEARWPPYPFWVFWRKEKSPWLAWDGNPDCPVFSLIAAPAMLS